MPREPLARPGAAVLTALLLALPVLGADHGELTAPTAVVARVSGTVTGETPGTGVVAVATRRVLRGEVRLAVPDGAAAELVCSTDRAVRIAGPRSDVPVVDACAGGRPLLPGSYRAMTSGNRSLVIERATATRLRILELKTRGSEEEDPRIPVLLGPRETAVRTPRPEIRWTRVPGTREYVLELEGADPWRVRLPAENVRCAPEEHPPRTLPVCSTPWPAGAPPLASGEKGEPSYLKVGARTGLVTPLRSSEARRLRLLPERTADEVNAALAALRALGPPPEEQHLREALLLASAGLRGEAAEGLRVGLAGRPSAEGFLLQGALELEAELPVAARRSFLEAACHAERAGLIHEAARGLEVAERLLNRQGRGLD